MAHGAFSPARGWRLAVGPASTRTLGLRWQQFVHQCQQIPASVSPVTASATSPKCIRAAPGILTPVAVMDGFASRHSHDPNHTAFSQRPRANSDGPPSEGPIPRFYFQGFRASSLRRQKSSCCASPPMALLARRDTTASSRCATVCMRGAGSTRGSELHQSFAPNDKRLETEA